MIELKLKQNYSTANNFIIKYNIFSLINCMVNSGFNYQPTYSIFRDSKKNNYKENDPTQHFLQ